MLGHEWSAIAFFNSNFRSRPLSTAHRKLGARTSVLNPRVSVSFMTNTSSLQQLDKQHLLRDFSALVEKDRRDTATLLAYIAEIDRRKLYLEHACPSMFAFCTTRFHMSEAIAAKRIRAGRAAYAFPCILDMVARGELHLSGIHQLAGHLTEENYEEVLQGARHKSMREIEGLIAEISPKPDVPTSIRALPTRKTSAPVETAPESPASPAAKPRGFCLHEAAVARPSPFSAALQAPGHDWGRDPGQAWGATSPTQSPNPGRQPGRDPRPSIGCPANRNEEEEGRPHGQTSPLWETERQQDARDPRPNSPGGIQPG